MAVASAQEVCHESSLGPIHFDTQVDKWILLLPSFKTSTCVICKYSTFVFNKVVRWDEWDEVENVYMVYSISYSVIFLPNIVKIDGHLTKFWHKQFVQFILRHGV